MNAPASRSRCSCSNRSEDPRHLAWRVNRIRPDPRARSEVFPLFIAVARSEDPRHLAWRVNQVGPATARTLLATSFTHGTRPWGSLRPAKPRHLAWRVNQIRPDPRARSEVFPLFIAVARSEDPRHLAWRVNQVGTATARALLATSFTHGTRPWGSLRPAKPPPPCVAGESGEPRCRRRFPIICFVAAPPFA